MQLVSYMKLTLIISYAHVIPEGFDKNEVESRKRVY